jgi:hypothetical protein
MKYTVNDLIGKQIAVHCGTKGKAEQIMQYFEDNGVMWLNGNKPTEEFFWCRHKEKTCYDLKDGLEGLLICSKGNYIKLGYKIIQFEDVDIPTSQQNITSALNSFQWSLGGSATIKPPDTPQNIKELMQQVNYTWEDVEYLIKASKNMV